MTAAAIPSADRLGAWCGWVVAVVFTMSPVFGWAAPLGFPPILALAGLVTLPAVRIPDADRPITIALLVALVWASGSMLWSPFSPADAEETTALKLALEAPLYWALICAARHATPAARRSAVVVFAWAMAVLGLLLVIEGATGAGLYRAVRVAMGDPIRPDLAVVKAAQGAYVLAVLWPLAAVAAVREARAPWLVLPMVAGVAAGGLGLAADAPLAAIVVGAVTAAVVWRWPRAMPRIAAVKAGLLFLAAPAILWAARASGLFAAIQPRAPLSWSQRMDYWRHAGDWISDRPFRGWGLDASRMFSPGIHLHPHDAALQVWLELGLIGAVAAALFWAILFLRLGRDQPDLAAAGGAAAAGAYLVIGAVSFGVWQDWWLAVGALAAVAYAALQRPPAPAPASPTSTLAPFSE